MAGAQIVGEWITVVAANLLGQVGTGPNVNTGAVGAASDGQSVWDLVVKGGPMMIPIVACSFVALSVIIERVFSLRRSRMIPPQFLRGLKKALEDNDGHEEALEYCRASDSAVARVFEAGIKRLGEPIELLEKHIQEAGQRAVFRLRKYLRALALIASISPLMGLLGTIFGMITAFQTVAGSGQALGRTELLAEGIYEALISTAAGLLVAIPVLIAYHWISAKTDHLVTEIDEMTVDFIEDYADGGRPALEGAVKSVAPGDNGAKSEAVEGDRDRARVEAAATT